MRAERSQPTELESARSAAAAEGLAGAGDLVAELAVARPQMRDLAALLALPRMWRERDATFIASSLLDVLVSLLRSDVGYVNMGCEKEQKLLEFARPTTTHAAEEIGRLLGASSASDGVTMETIPSPLGTGTVRMLRMSARLDDQQARIVIGSRRPDFPTDVETFLCRVALEQAMLAVKTSRLVANLTAANATKATFLATMSHELRTPLNAVIGYSELLLARIGGDLSDQQVLHVNRIEGAARHLLGLIEGILSFARLEAGKEEVDITEVDTAQLTDEVLALIEPLARVRGLEIQRSSGNAVPSIWTDQAKVRQILLNLLSNAVKFTKTGHVALDVRAERDGIRWTVTDTGVGIPPSELERIFEPFQQAAQTAAAGGRAAGTGLGLTVSRQLARLLGGDVAAQSIVGVGSTFVLRLPLRHFS